VTDRAGLEVFPSLVRGGKLHIRYSSPENEKLSLTLYDLQGQQIRRIHQGRVSKGMKRFRSSTEELPAGLYILRARTGHRSLSRKLVVED
jgi:hypothetical protein